MGLIALFKPYNYSEYKPESVLACDGQSRLLFHTHTVSLLSTCAMECFGWSSNRNKQLSIFFKFGTKTVIVERSRTVLPIKKEAPKHQWRPHN